MVSWPQKFFKPTLKAIEYCICNSRQLQILKIKFCEYFIYLPLLLLASFKPQPLMSETSTVSVNGEINKTLVCDGDFWFTATAKIWPSCVYWHT